MKIPSATEKFFADVFLADGTKVLKCSFSIFIQELKVKFAVFGSELTFEVGNKILGNTFLHIL